MPGINNNLYPPIFKKSYVPAFIKNSICKIYFSISAYNSTEEIASSLVQVTIQNQKTNQSVLSQTKYPSGIKITSLGIDSERGEEDKYYIEISQEDIEGSFNYNEYYKVQIRFTEANTIAPKIVDNIQKLDNWLSINLAKFSQWSTVVLIKPISKPILYLKSFSETASSTVIVTNDVTIVGTVHPDASTDYETYKNYRILIYDSMQNLIEDSGERYFESNNEIHYNCKYRFLEDDYILKIQILSKNLYFMEQTYNFKISYVNISEFQASISAKINNDKGCAVVSVTNNILAELGTNIVITRASSKDNFTYWEDVYTTLISSDDILDLKWEDYTIESGVWYKYAIAKRDKYNFRSVAIEMKNPVMADFEDIFLTTKNQQLKIKFDPQVNNYSRVVSQSLTETIGSKYPFIRRNGKVDYRTFSISGTISYFSDVGYNLMRASQDESYGDSAVYYKEYNLENNIDLYNDVIQEKVFREKVLDFLYENNVKLYKSATQGNILVKLMNITLTPNNTLSRQIYSFNCTAYEIDDFNYENCLKYDIQDNGKFVEQKEFLISKFGQIVTPSPNLYYSDSKISVLNEGSYYFGSNNLLNSLIKDKYKTLENDNMGISIENISYLKIMLTSDPYLIAIDNSGQPYRVETENTVNLDRTNLYLGHIAEINAKKIIINKDGIYELSDSNTDITNLSFDYPYEQGVIDFSVNIKESSKKNSDFKQYSLISRIGQLWGGFNILNNSSELIYTTIVNKYNIYRDDYEQQLQKIDSLCIQAAPGTAFYVRENQDRYYEKHILNETGLLEFCNADTDIRGLYIIGPTLTEISSEELEKEGLNDYEFYDTGQVISLSAIRNPKSNYVYSLSPFQRTEQDTLVIDEDELSIDSFDELAAWLQQQENNILWTTKNDEAEELDLETLGLFFLNSNKYIYYHGAWYPFTDDHIVVIPSIQAIIDYHCEVLIKEQ